MPSADNSEGSHFDQFKEEYGAYVLFAILFTSLLTNIFLLFRIQYGDIIITRLTTLPHKMSLAYLSAMSIQSLSVAVQAQYKDNSE